MMNWKKPSSWTVVAGRAQLDTTRAGRLLLAGSAVFISARAARLDGYWPLAPRTGARGWAARLGRSAPLVHVAVQQALLDAAPRGSRYALAADAYLRWGLESGASVVLIGGAETEHETHLDLLTFEAGRFIGYDNKTLPARSAPQFDAMLAALLADLAQQRPGFRRVQAAPLQHCASHFSAADYLDQSLFRRLAFRPLAARPPQQAAAARVPAALVAAGLLACAAGLGLGWQDYAAAQSAYAREIADPVVSGQGGLDNALIDVIQQRGVYLQRPRQEVPMIARAQQVLAGAAGVGQLRVLELRVGQPAPPEGGGRAADVWLRVAVPAQGGTALGQGRALMEQLAGATGMDVRLARNGWVDDGARRIFTLEGFIHG